MLYHGSRSCHTLSGRPRAERQNLDYGFSAAPALRQVGIAPFIPVTGFIFGTARHSATAGWYAVCPRAETALAEQIRRDRHHHGKVLFSVPCFSVFPCLWPYSSTAYSHYHGKKAAKNQTTGLLQNIISCAIMCPVRRNTASRDAPEFHERKAAP